MWALTGLLDDIDGARLADLLEVFSPAPDAEVDLGQTLPQRRADALAAMAAAAAANRTPLGTSGLSVLIDAADLTDAQQAVLADSTPITADTFDLLTCTAATSVPVVPAPSTRESPPASAARRSTVRDRRMDRGRDGEIGASGPG